MSDILSNNHERQFAPEDVSAIYERMHMLEIAEQLIDAAFGTEESNG